MYDKGTWQKNNYLEGYDEINERSFSFIKNDFFENKIASGISHGFVPIVDFFGI